MDPPFHFPTEYSSYDNQPGAPSAADGSLTYSNQDYRFSAQNTDARNTQLSTPSHLIQRPRIVGGQDCISSPGEYWKDVKVRRSMVGGTQITQMIFPTEQFTEGHVLLIPLREESEFEWNVSGIVLEVESGQKRFSLQSLVPAIFQKWPPVNNHKPKGYLARGEPSLGDWDPKGVMTWGDHTFVDNGDGTRSIWLHRP